MYMFVTCDVVRVGVPRTRIARGNGLPKIVPWTHPYRVIQPSTAGKVQGEQCGLPNRLLDRGCGPVR